MERNDLKRQDKNFKNLVEVEKLLSDLKFGSITLVVQDGLIVQVEKNEKIRFS